MKSYQRHLDTQIRRHFQQYQKVLILLGARQVGKTTLLKKIYPHAQYLLLDNDPIHSALESYDIHTYKQIIKADSASLKHPIILDEIHLLSNPGRAAKILFDQLPNIQLVITGSSSLNIKNKTAESLAGRKIDYHLYPLTFSEYLYQNQIENSLNFNLLHNILSPTPPKIKTHPFDLNQTLENTLIYGLYPDLINLPNDQTYLTNLADSVIFRDLLELKLISGQKNARQLLRLLAHQIGNLVNYTEIASRLQLNTRTVKKYIDIFEDSYLLFRVYPYSKVKRDEIGKMPKIYFYDTGLRNALIENFSPLLTRTNRGALFENFIISEVVKQNAYTGNQHHLNYWRTKRGFELDLVINSPNTLIGVEIKYSHGSVTQAFTNRYPQAKTKIITSTNFY